MQKLYKKVAPFAWILLIILMAPMLIKRNVPDTDTFFLAATGRWIVQNLSVPLINPFVIHEGFEVIIQQWGFDVLMYGLYDNFGSTGLLLYTLVAYGLTVFVMYKFFGLFTKNQSTKSIITLIAAFSFLSFASPRPTSITILIMLMFLYALEKWHQTSSWKWLIPLPFLSLLQINMHSSMWPMLFVLIVPYIFPHILVNKNELKIAVRAWFDRNKSLLLTMLVMAGVGFLNPNGLNGILYVFKSYGNVVPDGTSFEIAELAQPTFMDAMGLMVLVSVIFMTVFVTVNAKKLLEKGPEQHNRMIRLYTAAGTTLLAAMHLRNMWYLLIGALPLIAIMLDKMPPLPVNEKEQSGAKCAFKMISITLVVVLISAAMCGIMPYTVDENVDSEFTPVKAVEYLKNQDDVVLFNEFNSGAFLEWKGYEVYIDARPELFTKEINGKDDVLREYINVRDGRINYQEFLDKYDFTHLIVSNPFFAMYLDGHNEYVAVVRSDSYVMYEYAPPTLNDANP